MVNPLNFFRSSRSKTNEIEDDTLQAMPEALRELVEDGDAVELADSGQSAILDDASPLAAPADTTSSPDGSADSPLEAPPPAAATPNPPAAAPPSIPQPASATASSDSSAQQETVPAPAPQRRTIGTLIEQSEARTAPPQPPAVEILSEDQPDVVEILANSQPSADARSEPTELPEVAAEAPSEPTELPEVAADVPSEASVTEEPLIEVCEESLAPAPEELPPVPSGASAPPAPVAAAAAPEIPSAPEAPAANTPEPEKPIIEVVSDEVVPEEVVLPMPPGAEEGVQQAVAAQQAKEADAPQPASDPAGEERVVSEEPTTTPTEPAGLAEAEQETDPVVLIEEEAAPELLVEMDDVPEQAAEVGLSPDLAVDSEERGEPPVPQSEEPDVMLSEESEEQVRIQPQIADLVPSKESRAAALAETRAIYSEALQAVGRFFSAASKSKKKKAEALPVGDVERAATKLVAGMGRDHVGDGLVAAAVGAYPDEGSFIVPHSVNVAVLSQRVAKHLGLDGQELETLAVAGLLHDVGTVRLARNTFYKDDSLSKEEWVLMRQRPTLSAEIIRGLGPDYRAVAEISHQVHERLDGNGYPRGLHIDTIALEASILGAVDIFEAFIHPRPYKKTVPAAAMYGVDNLMRLSHQFGDGVLKALVRSVGLFPVGTYVRLNSGEVARVLRGRSTNPMRPEVEVVYDTQKQHLKKPRYVDLMATPHLYVFKPLSPEDLAEFGLK